MSYVDVVGAYPGVGGTLTRESGRSPSFQGSMAPAASAASTSATTARTALSEARARCSTCTTQTREGPCNDETAGNGLPQIA